ncbi:Alpha/Beta hydrolase protein [Fimicolochytrium jonesii]|uniref:Alpha/Beta hydrolase protein n=1 Tax=Fimicolochytrium jonesii TaxID=1396493 RepID=UPI0022FF1A1C|nr:Alpha/Beta hydrolase protein [Fimicolochytrium jonesii]KAI8826806.1 Alpha/Beta hydrolase protein [Fimicolochytrium jonesii]
MGAADTYGLTSKIQAEFALSTTVRNDHRYHPSAWTGSVQHLRQEQQLRQRADGLQSGRPSNTEISTLPAILILHGSPGGIDSAQWHARAISTFASPSAHPFGLFALSRPGYLSSGPVCASFAEEADVIIKTLDALGRTAPVAVLAISGSGPLALTLAEKFPDRINAVLMLDAITKRVPWSHTTLAALAMFGTELPSNTFAYRAATSGNVRDNVQKLLGEEALKEVETDKTVRHFFRDYSACYALGSVRRPGFFSDMNRIANMDDEPHWTGVKAPILCMHGLKDDLVSIAHPEHLLSTASTQDNAKRLMRFPDEKHILPLKQTSRAITKFLEETVW